MEHETSLRLLSAHDNKVAEVRGCGGVDVVKAWNAHKRCNENLHKNRNMDSPLDPRANLAISLARDTQHEFNNILAAACYTSLFAHRGSETDIRDHLSRAINRATGLMDQFFCLLRENNGPVERFDLREIINDLVTLFGSFPERRLSVAEVYGEPLWVELHRHTLFFSGAVLL